jgi:predicted HTH transcriptional regulator
MNIPVDGLREALVNAAAHRNMKTREERYCLKSLPTVWCFPVRVFRPNPSPWPVCAREDIGLLSKIPVLAQCLSYFHRIEERGSGFRRMREHMLNHGLDQPLLSTEMGYFQVTFSGTG